MVSYYFSCRNVFDCLENMVSVYPTVSLSYTQNVRDVKLSGRDFGIRLMDVQMKLQSYFAASNIFLIFKHTRPC